MMIQKQKLAIILLFIGVASQLLNQSRAQLDKGDIDALKSIKSWLYDGPGSTFFASWDFKQDPCSFEGVICDVVEGQERIAALNLGQPSSTSSGLRGRLHSSLGNLTQLVQLSLTPGKVVGSIPDSISRLTNLQNLGLSHNLLTGTISGQVFASLTQLTTLDLSFNRLSGSVPQEIASLNSLFALNLAHNRLSGSLPSVFSSSFLSHVDINRNSITGPLPASLPPSLTYLNLANNQLSGSLDPLALLPALTFIDLSRNQLWGSIPPSLLALPLSALLLHRNYLSGTVSPPTLVAIPTVDLSFNQLAGPISPFFAFVQNLFLNNNRFNGAVPQELIDQLLATSMQTLFLQHNFLTAFPALSPDIQLPLTASLCIQYNCALPPIQSPCPLNAGRQTIRPASQCNNPSSYTP